MRIPRIGRRSLASSAAGIDTVMGAYLSGWSSDRARLQALPWGRVDSVRDGLAGPRGREVLQEVVDEGCDMGF